MSPFITDAPIRAYPYRRTHPNTHTSRNIPLHPIHPAYACPVLAISEQSFGVGRIDSIQRLGRKVESLQQALQSIVKTVTRVQ